MSRFLYADHAATTALSPGALEAMMPYFRDTYGNPSSLYAFGQQAKSDLDAARAEVARCLNAKPEEIFFTSGGTESDNWALKAVAELRGGKGRHIITSAIEHHAILHTLEHLEKAQGFSVTYLPVDSLGRVDPQAVKAAIRPDTILITVMAANNEIGTIEPIAEIAAIAREAGVLFHTDAVQAAGHMSIDVKAMKKNGAKITVKNEGGETVISCDASKKKLTDAQKTELLRITSPVENTYASYEKSELARWKFDECKLEVHIDSDSSQPKSYTANVTAVRTGTDGTKSTRTESFDGRYVSVNGVGAVEMPKEYIDYDQNHTKK